jgi:syntaxin 1B/2/3
MEEFVDSGEGIQFFEKELIGSKKQEEAQLALHYIDTRHRDILRIKQSVEEIHQLMLDMEILVNLQGELIDEIASNVNDALGATNTARKQLRKALKDQKKSRKLMLCLVT